MLAVGALICSPALPQTAQGPTADTPFPAAQGPVEVIQGPRAKELVPPQLPLSQGMASHEGWVTLGYMVDVSGKPFEIIVLGSTGDKGFESAAMDALKRSTFEPSVLNGKPMESAGEVGYVFAGALETATGDFAATYGSLAREIDAKDEKQATDLLGRLKVTNLYEDAYYGLALYKYARVWGTEPAQLAGLKRAIAEWSGAMYLTRAEYKGALLETFSLEIRAHQYVEALATWDRLQKSGVDPQLEDKIKPIIEQLNVLRIDDTPYSLTDVVPDDGHWVLGLLKQHFRIAVAAGHLSGVNLYCAQHYVHSAFDPQLEYALDSEYGDCMIELVGTPGTKFTLEQL